MVLAVTPNSNRKKTLLFGFFVFSMSFTPLAVFLQFYFARNKLPVLARPVVDAVTLRTREFEKLIL